MSEVSSCDGRDTENGGCNLMELPDHVLMNILVYLDHNTLRRVASKMCMRLRNLARHRTLWLDATLTYTSSFEGGAGPGPHKYDYAQIFVRDLLATPYLRHLVVEEEDYFMSPCVLISMASTRCQIDKVWLYISEYPPELVLMLLRHPEIKELFLCDNATYDHAFYDPSGAVVTVDLPQLVFLDISQSRILELFVAGRFLSSISKKGRLQQLIADPVLWPKDHSYNPRPEPSEHAVKTLAWLIVGSRRSLRVLSVGQARTWIRWALSTCTHLEELSVEVDEPADRICALLEAMAKTPPRTLRKLTLKVPLTMPVQTLEAVLEVLSRVDAPIEELEVCFPEPDGPETVYTFPGFIAFLGLIVYKKPSRYRVLRVTNAVYVGNEELLALAEMAYLAQREDLAEECRQEGQDVQQLGLSLCRLELNGKCSYYRTYQECRIRALQVLRTAMPNLKIALNKCGCSSTPPLY